MLFLSLFLAGFTLGVFAALKIFAPEMREETWDPQHFSVKEVSKTSLNQDEVLIEKPLMKERAFPIKQPRFSIKRIM